MNSDKWTSQDEAELHRMQLRRGRFRDRVEGELKQVAQSVYGDFFAPDFVPQDTPIEQRIAELARVLEKHAHRIRAALAPFDEGPEAVEG